jgi:hypothetical protein
LTEQIAPPFKTQKGAYARLSDLVQKQPLYFNGYTGFALAAPSGHTVWIRAF